MHSLCVQSLVIAIFQLFHCWILLIAWFFPAWQPPIGWTIGIIQHAFMQNRARFHTWLLFDIQSSFCMWVEYQVASILTQQAGRSHSCLCVLRIGSHLLGLL
jgi:hypothetical protein